MAIHIPRKGSCIGGGTSASVFTLSPYLRSAQTGGSDQADCMLQSRSARASPRASFSLTRGTGALFLQCKRVCKSAPMASKSVTPPIAITLLRLNLSAAQPTGRAAASDARPEAACSKPTSAFVPVTVYRKVTCETGKRAPCYPAQCRDVAGCG